MLWRMGLQKIQMPHIPGVDHTWEILSPPGPFQLPPFALSPSYHESADSTRLERHIRTSSLKTRSNSPESWGESKAGLWCGKTNPKNIWDIICFLFPYQLQDKPLSHIRWMEKLTWEQLVVERIWCFCICDVWCQNYHHIPEWVFIVLDHPWWGPPKMSHMGRLDYPRQRFLGLPLSLKLIDHKHHVKVFLTN